MTFSCCAHKEFNDRLSSLDRQQVILCGIEAHICVYQTVCDLLESRKDVTVIADAVSSRTLENKRIALNKMAAAGANIGALNNGNGGIWMYRKHPVALPGATTFAVIIGFGSRAADIGDDVAGLAIRVVLLGNYKSVIEIG